MTPACLPRPLLGSLPLAFALLPSLAAGQSLTYAIDSSASPFTFSGTSSVGPIVGVPGTFDLGGSFELDPTYVRGEIGAAQFVGGSAVTLPSTLVGEIPNPIPIFPPLASLSVHDLRIAAGSAIFGVAPDGSFGTTVTFVVLEGSVDFVPLVGTPGSADIAGLVSDPTPVIGTLTRTEAETHLVFTIATTLPFDEPVLGVSGTIDLAGTVDAGFRFIETFCFGDGTGAACPCGNASPLEAGEGCVNSFGAGATLTASGLASVGADTLLLHGTQMPPSAPVLYFQGTAPSGGGGGTVFGDGLLCAAGSVIRLGAKFNVAGASTFPTQGNPISVRGEIPPGGATRWYQGWYRNQAEGFCTPERFNLTNGLRLTWVP